MSGEIIRTGIGPVWTRPGGAQATSAARTRATSTTPGPVRAGRPTADRGGAAAAGGAATSAIVALRSSRAPGNAGLAVDPRPASSTLGQPRPEGRQEPSTAPGSRAGVL